jgi:hypothetical protein
MGGKFDSGQEPFGQGAKEMESDERYYRRRAVEERMAAQRAVTETAREWHAKLAADYFERSGTAPAQMSA